MSWLNLHKAFIVAELAQGLHQTRSLMHRRMSNINHKCALWHQSVPNKLQNHELSSAWTLSLPANVPGQLYVVFVLHMDTPGRCLKQRRWRINFSEPDQLLRVYKMDQPRSSGLALFPPLSLRTIVLDPHLGFNPLHKKLPLSISGCSENLKSSNDTLYKCFDFNPAWWFASVRCHSAYRCCLLKVWSCDLYKQYNCYILSLRELCCWAITHPMVFSLANYWTNRTCKTIQHCVSMPHLRTGTLCEDCSLAACPQTLLVFEEHPNRL